MNDLISVIIPVYNVEAYLERCVDSVLSQTYKDLEIILVDDGSTDKSISICDAYAKKDQRIKVIHKENGGLSDARNAGLDMFNGNYVTFIDSDDWIEEDYIEYLHQLIVENQADLAVCDFNYIDEQGTLYNSPQNNGHVYIWNQKEALIKLLTGNKMETSAWAKLYKSSIFVENSIRYPYGRLFEDIPVTYVYILKSQSIVFGGRSLYNYFYRPQSISNMKFSPKRLHATEHLSMMIPQILQRYPELRKLCEIAEFRMNFGIYLTLDGRKVNEIYEKQVCDVIREKRRVVILSNKTSCKWKIKAMVTCFGITITKRLFAK